MSTILCRCFALISALLLTASSFAQQYSFRNFGVKDGLGAATVNAIFQDSRGHLWFATQGGGASRYNGHAFQTYTRSEGLTGNDVTCFAEDSEGNIWIGTSKGVSRFNGHEFKNFSEDDGLNVSSGIYSILCARDGKVWMGVRGAGAAVYDGSRFTYIGSEQGLPTDSKGFPNVYAIVQDGNGIIWMACTKAAASFDGNKVTVHDEEAVKGKSFFSAHVDRQGRVWFGGIPGKGVAVYDKGVFSEFNLPEELRWDFFGDITSDRRGNVWLATDHGALKVGEAGNTIFDKRSGLSGSSANCIASDNEGNIWIGLQGEGVDLLRNTAFVHFTGVDGLPGSQVTSVIPNLTGIGCIVGTSNNGLAEISCDNPDSTCIVRLISGTEGVAVNSIHQLDDGVVLVGSNAGFHVFESTNGLEYIRTVNTVEGKDLAAVMGFLSKDTNDIWVATFGSGLAHISNRGDTVFHAANGFPSDHILSLIYGEDGDILIGTLDAGILRYHNNNFEAFGQDVGVDSLVVWSMDWDGMGNLWMGTWYKGLCRYSSSGQKACYDKDDGLLSANISAVKWDAVNKCLWVGSGAGLQRLTLTPDGNIAAIRTYTDHLNGNVFDVNQNAIAIDGAGKVWFGSGNGVSSYDSQEDVKELHTPAPHLSKIRLAYKDVDWKEYSDSVDGFTGLPISLELPYNDNHLVFNLGLSTQDDARFSFRMVGQDSTWSPWTDVTEASFSNMAPGTYTFEVRAWSYSGLYSTEEGTVHFTFTISSPWWQTWWARSGGTVILVAGLMAFVKGRERILKKQNLKLEQTVTERTAEVVEEKKKVEEKHYALTESIVYAQRLQAAVMPPQEAVRTLFPDSFLLFLPRDVVSGDFYWCEERDGIRYVAVGDCTGHGVPGAMLSIIGLNGLNRALNELNITAPAEFLTQLTHDIHTSFERSDKTVRDGMDLSLCAIDTAAMKVTFCGANNPLWIARNGEILIFKPNRRPVGFHDIEGVGFKQEEVKLQKGDILYLMSDGYQDQLGGEHYRKLMTKVFRNRLTELSALSLQEQHAMLISELDSWKGTYKQTDDVCVMGIRI